MSYVSTLGTPQLSHRHAVPEGPGYLAHGRKVSYQLINTPSQHSAAQLRMADIDGPSRPTPTFQRALIVSTNPPATPDQL